MNDFMDLIGQFLIWGGCGSIGAITIWTLISWKKSVDRDKKDKERVVEQLSDSNIESDLKKSLVVNAGNSKYVVLRHWPEQVSEKYLDMEWMPAFVTSIGVLGTFLGISIGLMEMDLVNPAEQNATKKMMTSISQLFVGMKTAFFTSVAGISAGLLLSLFRNKRFIKRLEWQHKNCLKKLEDCRVRIFCPSDVLEQSGSQEIVMAAREMAESARNFNADAIATKMTESLNPVLHKISNELSQLADIKKDNGEEILRAMMNDLRSEVIEPISERLNSTASLVDQSTNSVKQLTETISPLGEELSITVDKLQQHQRESIETIENVLTRFQEDVGEKLSSQLTSAGEILSETLDKLNNDLGVHLETLNSLAAQMPSLDAELVASIESVLNQVTGSSRQLLKQLQEGADVQVSQLNSLVDEVTKYHSTSREFLEQYFKSVDESSTKVHEKLLDVATVLAGASSVSSAPLAENGALS